MSPPPLREDEIAPILSTLREVNESLDRRSRRASASVGVTWGVVASSIFAFYAWVYFDPCNAVVCPLRDAGLLPWVWVPPVLVGYLLTLATGARLGRMDPSSEGARATRWLQLALLPPILVTVAANVLERGEGLIPSMWLAFLGVVNLQWGCHKGTPIERAATWGSFALGALLLIAPPAWAYLAASLWYLAALAALCAWRYHHA